MDHPAGGQLFAQRVRLSYRLSHRVVYYPSNQVSNAGGLYKDVEEDEEESATDLKKREELLINHIFGVDMTQNMAVRSQNYRSIEIP